MNIYVGHLADSVTDDDLRELFTEYGEVTSAKVIRDMFSKTSRGFGFVEMASADDGKQAITGLNGKELKGQPIRVNEARPREDKKRRGGGGGGGRGKRW
ncbi:MAG: RNA-binding protein [bacterium]|nr:RNA-binding protein [bacterium]